MSMSQGPDDDDPGISDNDYEGEKDSGTFSKVNYEQDTGRIDVYYGERGGHEHGHIVTSDDSTVNYLRDDDGEIYRDR